MSAMDVLRNNQNPQPENLCWMYNTMHPVSS